MILSRACRPKFHHKEMQDKSALGRHDKHRGRAIERKRRGLILPPSLPVIRADKASIAAAISARTRPLIRLWLNTRSEHRWRAYQADIGSTLATVGKPIASTTLADLQAGIDPSQLPSLPFPKRHL